MNVCLLLGVLLGLAVIAIAIAVWPLFHRRRMGEEEIKLWQKIGGRGEFTSFRFDDMQEPPRGLVFQVDEEKYIVQAGRSGYLKVEPYW